MLSVLLSIVVDKELLEKAKLAPEDTVEVFVVLKQQYIAKRKGKDELSNVKHFNERARRSFMNFIRGLEGIYEVKSVWVVNAIYIKMKAKLINELLRRNDVRSITLDDGHYFLIAERDRTSTKAVSSWGISYIRADSAWKLGYTGSGVIVGHIDSGIDTTHPALSGDYYRDLGGIYWYDPQTNYTSPTDDNGHGTHTAGTIVGGDGLGSFTEDIGVAPDAKIISCKACGPGASCSQFALASCVQWFAELKANNNIDVRLVNNSWGGGGGDPWLWEAIWNGWRALDIIPVFSIGNLCSAPPPSSPGDYPIVIGVGSIDSDGSMSSFSCTGPSPNTYPYNQTAYWSRDDWNYTKPDISAPGRSINSSIPGGSYAAYSGTSMASPHVSGVIALMLSKNPNLSYYDVYRILTDFGRTRPNTCSTVWPNNYCGWGVVDAILALENTPPDTLPFMKLVSYAILNDNNANGRLDPGENADVSIRLYNPTSRTASNLTAKLRAISSGITITDSTIVFGDIPPYTDTLATSDLFSVSVSPNFPYGTYANFMLELNYSGRTQLIPLSIIVGDPVQFVDIDTANAVLSITGTGGIGYTSQDRIEGNGFIYPKGNVQSVLYYASFAIGNSSNYVADNFYNQGGDFVRLTAIVPSVVSDESYEVVFSDENHPNPYSLSVKHVAYAGTGSNRIYLHYTISNEGTTNVSGLYAGIFADFDINDYTNDQGYALKCGSENFVVMYSSDYAYYVGIGLVQGNLANASLMSNPTYVYPGLTEANKFAFLSGSLGDSASSSPSDWTAVVSAGPYDIPPGDSIALTFIFFGSDVQPDCNTVASSEGNYEEVLFLKNAILVNPAKETSIEIYDITGRMLYRKDVSKQTRIDMSKFSRGIYILKLGRKTYKFVR